MNLQNGENKMRMFSDADDYRSEMSTREEQELKRKYEHLKKHGRINDIRRIEELEKKNEALIEKLKEALELDCWYCGGVQYGHDSEFRIEVEKLIGTYEE